MSVWKLLNTYMLSNEVRIHCVIIKEKKTFLSKKNIYILNFKFFSTKLNSSTLYIKILHWQKMPVNTICGTSNNVAHQLINVQSES